MKLLALVIWLWLVVWLTFMLTQRPNFMSDDAIIEPSEITSSFNRNVSLDMGKTQKLYNIVQALA